MNLEEYNKKRCEIEAAHKSELNKLMRQYAVSNSIAEVGDIVIDHHQAVLVDRMVVYADREKPCLIYKGAQLTKKLKPRVNKIIGSSYQFDIKKVVKNGN